MRAAKALVSLRICADSPKSLLLAYAISTKISFVGLIIMFHVWATFYYRTMKNNTSVCGSISFCINLNIQSKHNDPMIDRCRFCAIQLVRKVLRPYKV